MKHPADRDPGQQNPSSESCSSSRRKFLKVTAAAAAFAAAGSPLDAMRRVASGSPVMSAANTRPGRIVLYRDPAMGGHTSVDKFRVEEVVHHAVQILTERGETANAFESLFPGIYASSKIAIKVNTIGPCWTRWEVVRGIVSGLSMMLGGTYDVSNVTIFDRDNIANAGYTASEFTFGGNTAFLATGNNAYQSGYWIHGKELSRYLLNADYVINVPVLKSHNDPQNQITVAEKNHYGSCRPSNLCGLTDAMLDLNADPNIKDKTTLVVTSAIYGTYNGGPNTPPMYWDTFPEQTPNMIFATTDPVTNEYWAKDIINAERGSHGWLDKPCPWIEDGSLPQWNLGISDPELMTVLRLDATNAEEPETIVGGTFLAANVPNPFRERTDLRFRLDRAGHAEMRIFDASGRVVRDLGGRELRQGYHTVPWDARDAHGRRVPAGVYFAVLATPRVKRTRRLIVAR
jgi:hypothetical protein